METKRKTINKEKCESLKYTFEIYTKRKSINKDKMLMGFAKDVMPTTFFLKREYSE